MFCATDSCANLCDDMCRGGIGLTLFARGALFAQIIDQYLLESSQQTVSLQTAMQFFPVWTQRHNGTGFHVTDIPHIIREATGVEVQSLFDRYIGSYNG